MQPPAAGPVRQGKTRPTELWDDTAPHRRYEPHSSRRYQEVMRQRRSRQWKTGCSLVKLAVLGAFLIVLLYFFAPIRTTILLLGNDARPGEGNVGRTDTLILATIVPLRPYVGTLSVPRDLWVEVPGVGPERINTAHFYGEAEETGLGPAAAMLTVKENFGVEVNYYVRFRFEGFKEVIDAFGGLDVDLPTDMSGFTAGKHHLTGEEALALVRDRAGSDDFSRMGRAQIFLKAILNQALTPASWPYLPEALAALTSAADTNVPFWQWPRLGFALLRAGPNGIDGRTIGRDLVTPFRTGGGADVLAPNWDLINPVLEEMFGVER